MPDSLINQSKPTLSIPPRALPVVVITSDRWCRQCGNLKATEDFYTQERHGRSYRMTACKDCHRARVAVRKQTIRENLAQSAGRRAACR